MSKFVLAAVIAIVYIIFLFLEMRFVMKENKPLKNLFRDGLLVYLSVLVGDFLLNQLAPLRKEMHLQLRMCSQMLPIFNVY